MRIQSRSGLRCERQYPELAVIPHHIAARQAVLDGEIAVLDEKGVSRFHLIQPRIANSDPNAMAHLVRSTPVVYFAFDLLYLDGYDLRNVQPERARESCCRRWSRPEPCCGSPRLSPARARRCWRRRGSTAWKASSPSAPPAATNPGAAASGSRSRSATSRNSSIGGFTAPQGGREYFGALVLGVYEDGKLRWAGNVGTGFDQKTAGRPPRAAASRWSPKSARSPSAPSRTAASPG